MPATVETRELPMLQLRASPLPGTWNEEKRTIEITWTTGAKGLRRSFWSDDYYEELSLDPAHVRMDRLNSGASPLLDAHRSYGGVRAVIGVVERAWLEKGEGRAVVRFSNRDEVAPIVQDVKDGILRNISVGYTVHEYERIRAEEKGQPDTYRAIDWEPAEVSLVPIGFDAGAQVRSADQNMHAVKITTRGAPATETEDKEMPTEAPAAVEQQRATPDNDAAAAAIKAARDEAAKAERQRAADIRTAVRAAGLDDELAQQLIDDGVAIDAARAQIIDKLAERQAEEQPDTRSQHRIEPGQTADEKFIEGARNWIFEKAGVRHLVDKDGKLDGGEFRGLRMLDIARMSLERRGVKTAGMMPMDIVARAFTYRGAYNGTSDFAVLLENTMHKVLLAAYATAPDTWRRFCRVGSVSDFRVHNRYRLGSFGPLDSLNEHGEFKNKQIPDGAKEVISARTKGNIIGITREAVINDDMGAFNGLATAFGRSAGLSIETDVYAALALNGGLGPNLQDGNPLFHNRAGRNNIGTGSALSVAGLDGDRQTMASIKDLSGNEYLDLRPAILLVPMSLGGEARVINDSQYDLDGVNGANSANKFMKPNKVRGLFRDIVDTPRLSGTRRYLFADPAVAPVLEVAFLDGQQSPFLESQEGWRVDGTEWKVRLDYGVGAIACEGATTNAGA